MLEEWLVGSRQLRRRVLGRHQFLLRQGRGELSGVMSDSGTQPTCLAASTMFALGWRSQPVEATLYLRGKRWSAEWNEDFIEVLLRQRRRSCGIAGSAGSR